MTKVLEWQLENTQGTKEECVSWLKQEYGDGRLDINDGNVEPVSKRARTER